MPIDPRISLQVQPPPFADPGLQRQRAITTADLIGRRKEASETHAQNMQIGDLTKRLEELKVVEAKADRLGSIASGVLSVQELEKPGAYQRALQMARQERLITDENLFQTPQKWGPDAEAQLMQAVQGSRSAKEQIQAQQYQLLNLIREGELRNKQDRTAIEADKVQVSRDRLAQRETEFADLSKYRGKMLEQRVEEFKQRIVRDTNMNDNDKSRLLLMAEQELGRNRRFDIGESGRNTRFAEGEAGKTDRLQYLQEEVTKRSTARNKSQESSAKNFAAALSTTKKLLELQGINFNDLEIDQQIEAIQVPFEQYQANGPITVKSEKGAPRWGGLRSGKDVLLPSAGVNPNPTAIPPPAGPPATVAGGVVPPPVASKTTTRLKVQAYADANGIDYATAEAAYKSKGYTIQ